ncbi:UDP-N-acetylmuramoyl-L-alanine--D-glutamate ligase [Thiotrichales bacterium 19S3-7]|nr:UDP-N-acetylmuramoyl-L-alanine--D-glutamate ligase [Thiotrichales bacterium 19S3-7]MCF6801792.1 UDP-N-acetylmuramoyl-L-alanine--D-glutamate ligase [Thiotrichales bacterium 19S3-11]
MNTIKEKKTLYYQKIQIRKVLILGLGISGISAMNYIANNYNLLIYVYDDHHPLNLADEVIQVNELNQLSKIDLVIASPGFDLREKRFNALDKLNCPIICDIELFSHLTNKPMIAITGSNAKSTVTSLITSLLNQLGIKAQAGGNIGLAVFDLLDIECDVFILELSSFQLDLMQSFSAVIGIITNISKDHLDRYHDYQSYKQSKLQLAKRVRHLICSFKLSTQISHPNITYYDKQHTISVSNEHITYHDDAFVCIKDIQLKGSHNHLNIIMSLVAIETYLNTQKITHSITVKTNAFRSTLLTFQNLPSRCHVFANYHGINWVDDSKGTNIDATKAAIMGLSSTHHTKNCILILGGMTKGGDFSELQTVIDQYVKAIYVFGQDRELINNQIEHPQIKLYAKLDEVVFKIKHNAVAGDIILFSPACASFDQFDNYLQRGQYFRALVERLNTIKQMEP